MLRSLSIISICNLANAVFPFLLLPIITRLISIEEYGHLVTIETFLALTLPFIQFSITGIVVEFFKLSKKDFGSYVVNSLVLVLPVFFIIELLLLIFSRYIARKFSVDEVWLHVLPVIVLLNLSIQAISSIYQCQKKYKKYLFFLVGPNFLIFILTVYFLLFLQAGWQSKLYAIAISFFLFSLVATYILVTDVCKKSRLSISMMSLNLNFTLPLIPHSVAAGLYFMADRLFLAEILGNASVAIYVAGMQLALIMSVMQNAISKAWVPFVLEYLRKHELEPRLFSKLYRYMFIGVIFVIILSALIALLIYTLAGYLLPENYEQSKYLGMLLVSAFCFLGFYKIVSPILWFHKRSKALSKVTIFVFLINLILNSILIPLFGIYGACYATIASVVLQFLFTWFLVIREVNKHIKGFVNGQ